MSLRLYRVDWTPLHYTGPLEDREIDFLEEFRSDDGTYCIEEGVLDETILGLVQEGRQDEIPHELVQLLREKVREAGEGISMALL